jgi:putative SOS response-associated peptidase YedK
MCVNYLPASRQALENNFNASMQGEFDWKAEAWQDYPAPIIIGQEGYRKAVVGLYSMIPKTHLQPGVKRFSTMNARAETVGNLRSYAKHWREGRLCLVPMTGFFEPNYESGAAVRWKIGMADGSPFAVAGLYRTWEELDGAESYSFTQITINADDHPLMRRFHKPGDEKRSLVIVPAQDYDDWLECRDPERARAYLLPYPAELMAAILAPKTVSKKSESAVNQSLFD